MKFPIPKTGVRMLALGCDKDQVRKDLAMDGFVVIRMEGECTARQRSSPGVF